jgi:hypothetical protein
VPRSVVGLLFGVLLVMFPVELPVEYLLFLLVVISSPLFEFLLVWLPLLIAEPEFLKLLLVEATDLELLMLAPFLELPLLKAV